MRVAICIFASSLCFALSASAQGWSDYSLDIGDGYQIIRANDIDVMLCRDGSIILDRTIYGLLGPVIGYAQNGAHIFAKMAGTKLRNLFPGDTFREVDETKLSYFIVTKGSDAIAGPFNEDEFVARPELLNKPAVEWIAPHNPNIVAPVLGALFFFVVAIPILIVTKPLIGLPMLLLPLVLLYASYRILRAVLRRLRGRAVVPTQPIDRPS